MDTEVLINPQTNTNILLNLENLLNEDLGINQEICGVRIVFDHDQLENLRITLTSPAGQTITLIGPGTVMSDFTDQITWNIAFTQCINQAFPDDGFSDQWDSDQGWEIFENYMGTYYPFQGCLEDFNTGSANGNWQVNIENLGLSSGTLYYFELIFCNDAGSDCNTCFLDVSEFDENYAIFCREDGRLSDISELLEIESVINTDQRFDYILSQNDSIIDTGESLSNLEDLLPGIYEICGMVSTINDSLLISTLDSVSIIRELIDQKLICADITQFCLTIEILEPALETFIDTTFCFGDTLMIRDIMVLNNIDTQFTIFDTISNQPFTIACDSIVHLKATAVQIDAIVTTNQSFVQCGKSVFLNATASTSSPFPIIDYRWTTGGGNLVNDIGPIAEINMAGSYKLEVVNSFCSDTISINMSSVDSFDLDPSYNPAVCFYDTITTFFNSSVLTDSIKVSGPGIINQNPSGFATINDGTYYINAFYGNCTENDTIEIINEATELEIQVSSNRITCDIPLSTIEYNTNAINPEITFMGPEIIPDNTLLPQVDLPGIYSIEIVDESGCFISEPLEVQIDTIAPQLETNDINRLCSIESVELPLNILTPFDSLEWTGPSGFSSSLINPQASEQGEYIVIVTAENGCISTASLDLVVLNMSFPVEISGDFLDCSKDSIELCIETNSILDSVSWFFNGDIINNEACYYVKEEGEYSFVAFDENGCFVNGLTYIPDISEDIGINILADNNILDCLTEEITLTAETISSSSNIEYFWTLENQNFGSGNVQTITEEGNYTLTAVDTITACRDSAEIFITSLDNDISGLELMTQQPLCEGEEGSINFEQIPPGLEFDLFVNNQAMEFTPELNGLIPGEYEIELLSDQGCRFDSTVVINEGNIVFVDLGDDISANIGEEVDILVDLSHPIEALEVFQWSDPQVLSCLECLEPTITALDNMVLSLEIEDEIGCRAKDEINIIVDKNIDIFVPNVFTPNYDGDNDILTLFISDGIVKIFDIRITDRWGNLVFFHPEITREVNNFSWDGTYKGENLVSGVYVFMAKLLLLDNSETIIVEDITLLR
ncbi:MAG: gliding motility-associated C-terminal domain-containing protein [Bacteroidia bacterium]|nr:gliding motility-associated C-terminal domain-containing protein [Bacteroidia bacterium]